MIAELFEYGAPVAAVAGSVAAAIYVPPPLKRLVIEGLVLGAVASFVYGAGRAAGDAACSTQLAVITQANEKALHEAEKRVREKNAADAALLQAEVDRLLHEAETSATELAAARADISAAGASADAPAPSVILRAIRK